ncbi:MAG: SPFH domain-containing protein [Anaerolineae bacterium]|nr:SPFH domain-containing protein [Anaerolineae bacterium]MDW8099917.1 SPFH domain-containing protein [Anaerolineae bacterium]
MNAWLSPSPSGRPFLRWLLGALLLALAVASVTALRIGPLRWAAFLLVTVAWSLLIAPPYRLVFLIPLIFLTGSGLAFDLIPLLWPMDEPMHIELTQRAGSMALLGLLSILGIAGLVVVIFATLAFLSSELVLAMHPVRELGRGAVVFHLLKTALGLPGSCFVVENGEVKQKDGRDGILHRLGGPGLLMVKPCQAVVLERGGEITNIVGPHTYTLRPFERIRGVIRLEPKLLTLDLRDVLTADGLTVPRVLAKVGYRFPQASVDGRSAGDGPFTGVIRDALYPTRREDLKKMLMIEPNPAEWDRAVEKIAAIAIRTVIGRHTLEGLFPLDREPVSIVEGQAQGPYDILSSEAERECRARTANWGVEITTLRLDSMDLPEELRSRALAPWVADREKMLSMTQGEVDVKRERAFEEVRLSARRKAMRESLDQLIELYTKMPPETADRLANLIVNLATRFAEDTAQGMRLVGALEKAIESSQIIISIGQSPSMFLTPPERPGGGITEPDVEPRQ